MWHVVVAALVTSTTSSPGIGSILVFVRPLKLTQPGHPPVGLSIGYGSATAGEETASDA